MTKKFRRGTNKESSANSSKEKSDFSTDDQARGVNFSNTENNNIGTYYQEYKEATKAVFHGLSSLVPSNVPLVSVNDLARASDFIFDSSLQINQFLNSCCAEEEEGELVLAKKVKEFHQMIPQTIFVPHSLIQKLEATIELRSKVMHKYIHEDSNDHGHAHILLVLRYSLDVLNACRKLTKSVKQLANKLFARWNKTATSTTNGHIKEDGDNVNSSFTNRFDVLISLNNKGDDLGDTDEDDENNSDEEKSNRKLDEMIQERKDGIKSSAPDITEATDIYSIEEDLIKGSDRLQACSLLFTMESLLEIVSSKYKSLKERMRNNDCSDPHYLMYCAVVTNKCIQSIQSAEAALVLDFPYLSSIFAILGIVLLPEHITRLEQQIAQLALSSSTPTGSGKKAKRKKKKKKCSRGDIVKCVGEIIENSFCDNNVLKHEKIVEYLSRTTGLSETKMNEWYLNVISTFERGYKDEYRFLSDHKYIGGNRSIIHTIEKLQKMILSTSTHDVNQSRMKPEKETQHSRTADGNMSEIHTESILFEIFAWCSPNYFVNDCVPASFVLDRLSCFNTFSTITVLHSFRKFLKEKETKTHPVPSTIVFSIHCVLTSIIDMQGDDDISRIAKNTEKTWEKFFKKLKPKIEPNALIENDDDFKNFNFGRLLVFARFLLEPAEEETDKKCCDERKVALLNPLMSGNYLLFANYVLSIMIGTGYTSHGQLRLVLHMYNAFIELGFFEDNDSDLTLLEDAHRVFKNVPPIWAQARVPEHGEYTKQFLLAWGFVPKIATQIKKSFGSGGKTDRQCYPSSRRMSVNINPKDYCLTYDPIMSGVFNDRGVISEEKKSQREILSETTLNMNTMENDMSEDKRNNVLWTNWLEVSYLLDSFIRNFVNFHLDEFVDNPDHVRRTIDFFYRKNYLMDEFELYNRKICMQVLHAIDENPDSAIGAKCAGEFE